MINMKRNIIIKGKIFIALLLVVLNVGFINTGTVSGQAEECSESRLRDSTVSILNCTGSNECSPSNSGIASKTLKSGDSVYILGDSITVRSNATYRTAFAEKQINPYINAAESRSWNSPGQGTPTSEGSTKPGKQAVEDDSAQISSAKGIIIALGTNGGTGGNPISDVISKIREKNPTAPIWWVNTATSSKWPTNLAYLGEFNTKLTSEATVRGFSVIDWLKTVNPGGDPSVIPTGDAANLLADGVHTSSDGTRKLVDLVVSSTTSGSGATTGSSASSDCSCSVGGEGPISMAASMNIPEPHKAIIERAASKFSVSPNLIAALFLSEQGNVWKPLDSQWASSPVGASGPFQFMPGTWGAYKQDGNGDGAIDIMNFEDAAYAAAALAATGTNQSTPLGDLAKPFAPNTMIYFSAVYNWGGGNVQKKTNPESGLSAAPTETQNYMKNIHAVISSDFTKSGHDKYGPPRMPGEANNTSTGTTGEATASTGGCLSSGSNTQLVASNDAEARAIILASSNLGWGNYGSASSQKDDIENCLTTTTLISIATIAQNSGVKVPVNALATDHGGCTGSGESRHNQGRAIDIGYYGNNSQGADRHVSEGDTLYRFLFDNRDVLKIDELIWQYPPSGYKCIEEGVVGECDTVFSAATMNEHYHHIHVGFKQEGAL